MRNEDQPGSQAQHESRSIRRPLHGAEVVLAVTLFVSVYLATFLAAGYGARALGLLYVQWIALLSVSVASVVSIRTLEGGRWGLGLFVRPRLALADSIRGAAFAVLMIGSADLLVTGSAGLRHAPGGAFPWFELIAVFAPAAFHEEMAFRGYLFQKMRRWNRGLAIAATSLSFALLHFGNRGISAIAVMNLLLAGVLLALAYERYERLWFPIAIHFFWNVLSGPILGWGVSGYAAGSSLLRTVGSGAAWLTGGRFGIEGSVWMAVVEAGGICWMIWNSSRQFAVNR